MKKTTTIYLEKKLLDKFSVISAIKGDKLTYVIEEAVRNYIIKNTAEANEKVFKMLNDDGNLSN